VLASEAIVELVDVAKWCLLYSSSQQLASQ
jgi:hypothetical protein